MHESYPTTVTFDQNYIPWIKYYNETDGANITYGHYLVIDLSLLTVFDEGVHEVHFTIADSKGNARKYT